MAFTPQIQNNFLTKITLTLLFGLISSSANENWIQIKPIEETKTQKASTKQDVNLSQIEPINKIMKNATAIQRLIDARKKKDKPITDDKNWFVLEGNK